MQLLNKRRNKHRFRSFFIDVLMGALASLALPPIFILPALFLLGVPVWRVIHAHDRATAAYIFGAAGFGWFLASTFWVSHSLIVKAPSLWFFTPFIAMGLAIILAMFWAAAGAISWTGRRPPLERLSWVIAALALMEWARSFVASGLPWSLMGGIFAVHENSLQMASLIGVYGLTLLAFGCAVAPLFWMLSARRIASLFILLPLCGTLWGALRLDDQPVLTKNAMPNVRLVQPAIPQKDKWDRRKRDGHLANLVELSQAGNSKPDFVIWPETAFAGLPGQNRQLLADTVRAATNKNGFLLTGIPRFNFENRLLNSVFLFDHRSGLRGIYDKRHLVPFGEYVPFRSWLPFLDVVAGPTDFVSGAQNYVMLVPGIGRVQTLICYEVIFAGRVVEPKNRPDVLVNVTNDAWFGETVGPWQHLHHAQMRAVEEGVPLLRVANTGVSAVFDGFGRQLASLPLGTRDYLDITVPPLLTATLFARFGNDIFLVLCLGIFGISHYMSWRQKLKEKSDS